METKVLYDLTNPQMNIFLREQYYNNNAINIIAGYLRIDKKIKLEVIDEMLNMLIEESDNMRIRITKGEEDNKPYQYIAEYQYREIPAVYVSSKTEKEIMKLIEEDLQEPMELFESDLYQLKIYQLRNNINIITMKMHHIIADAWTFKLMGDRTLDNYSRIIKDKEGLKKFSYLSYIKEEQKYIEGETFQKDREYWEGYLQDIYEPAVLKDISLNQDITSFRIERKLPRKIHNKIINYCQNNKITPYSFFLSILSIYLNKTTGKEKFTIGTPLLNRKNFEEKNTGGMFISTIPLKVKIDNNTTIKQLCSSFAKDTRQALRHQRYPYLSMLEYIRKNNEHFNKLFDVMLSFQNIKVGGTKDLPKSIHGWTYNNNQQTQFEFHISQHSDAQPFVLGFDFKNDVANEEERNLIISRIIYLIKNIVYAEDKNLKIRDVEFIPLQELKQLDKIMGVTNLKTFKNGRNHTLKDRFEKQAQKNPNKIAVKFKKEVLSYKEINEKANLLADRLIEEGVAKGDAVILILDRSIEMAISILGVIKTGAYFVPVAIDWPHDRVKYIIKNSNAKHLISAGRFLNNDYKIKKLDVKKLLYDDGKFEEKKKNKPTNFSSKEVIYILYTSGSTGNPKGVLMTHKNVSALLDGMRKTYSLEADDIWPMFHSYTFDAAMWEFFCSLSSGGTLVIVPNDIRLDSKKMLYFLKDEKISILCQTPSYFYKLVVHDEKENLQEEDLKLKYIFLGGESVYSKPIQPWSNKYKNTKIINGYGPTETTVYISTGEITKEDIEKEDIYIGKPVVGDVVEIRDKNRKLLPIGCKGELYMAGLGISLGYLNDEKRTKEVFLKENGRQIYKSGDVGYYNTDGRITFLGRNDGQTKIRGFRVETQEVENALLNCEEVTRAVVLVLSEKNYTKKLVAFIETKKKNYVDMVISEISKTLTPYMIPELYQLSEFPLTTSGKIDRMKLLNKLDELRDEDREILEPENDIEEEILKIVKKITKKRKVSTKDDFFLYLNMDSLDVMSFATSLSEFNITAQDINDNTNIKVLAEVVLERQKESARFQRLIKEKLEDVDIINKVHVFNLSNVLLTGSTGFVGAHILMELIQQDEVEKVYCLIRKKLNKTIEERFNIIVEKYFQDVNKKYLDKVVLVEGNFEEIDLGLSKNDFDNMKEKIKTIVHVGANVKHFGNYGVSYKTNVEGTQEVIKFAKKISSAIAHISTLSVAGFSNINDVKLLDENKLYINQMFFKNVYLTTKYKAEVEILEGIQKDEIKAKIFRIGNIMPRITDSVFQSNINENAFLNKIRTCLNMGMIAEELLNYPIDLTPVDLAAKAIVLLLKGREKQSIYHIVNNNYINIGDVVKYARPELKIEDARTQIKEIQKLNDPRNGILLASLQVLNFIENPNDSKITTKRLEKKNFTWELPSEKYIKSLLELSNF